MKSQRFIERRQPQRRTAVAWARRRGMEGILDWLATRWAWSTGVDFISSKSGGLATKLKKRNIVYLSPCKGVSVSLSSWETRRWRLLGRANYQEVMKSSTKRPLRGRNRSSADGP